MNVINVKIKNEDYKRTDNLYRTTCTSPALNWGESLASRPGRFTPGKDIAVPFEWEGWLAVQLAWARSRRESFVPRREWNGSSIYSASNLVPIPTPLFHIHINWICVGSQYTYNSHIGNRMSSCKQKEVLDDTVYMRQKQQIKTDLFPEPRGMGYAGWNRCVDWRILG